MIKCPLISFGKRYCAEVNCMGKECMLWSMNRNACLIRLALLKYTANAPTDEKDSIETKIKKLERQVQMASIGFPTYPFEVSPKGMEINSIEKDWSGLQGGL